MEELTREPITLSVGSAGMLTPNVNVATARGMKSHTIPGWERCWKITSSGLGGRKYENDEE